MNTSVIDSFVIMRVTSTFSALEKLRRSSNRGLRNTSEYAIWLIKGGRHQDVPMRGNLPQEPPPTYEETIQKSEQATPNTTKLMISYQWDSKPIARKIRDSLVNNGFIVWMDETHMSKVVFITYFTIQIFS